MAISLTPHQTICGIFGRLLCYPEADLAEAARRCGDLLENVSPRAAGELKRFHRFTEGHPAARIEEVYTSTFDLQPLCHPYLGYQLCGESRNRTLFLLGLKELYREHGFEAKGELPDHLGEVLRFLSVARDPEVREELVTDGLLPALGKLVGSFEDRDHPYFALLGSLQAFLEEDSGGAGQKEVAP